MPFGITPAAIGAAIADELPKIFDDAVNRARDGGPSTIKDGNPTSIPGRVGQAVSRSACRRYGAGLLNLSESRAEKVEAACRPYLDSLDPDEGPSIETPFSGGQCPVLYNVSYTTEVRNSSTFQCGTFGNPANVTTLIGGSPVLGPIGAPTEVLAAGGAGSSTNANQKFELSTGSGDRLLSLGGAGTRFHLASCGPTYRVTNFAVTRVDGQADNCGSPAPIVTQPDPIPDPTPPPFRFNPDPSVDIDIDVDVTPEGDIIFDIGGGPVTVDPFPPDGGGDDSGPTGPGPGDIGDAGGPSDTGSGGDADASAPAGQVLVGIRIDVLSSPPKARQYAPGVFRGAGYIYMGVTGNLDQDYGGSMLKTGQFFFAEKDNLTHWEVSANNGFDWRVTPYYREAIG